MAEGPVNTRRAFKDSADRMLDFVAVDTNLGPMVEPRPLLQQYEGGIFSLEASSLFYRNYTSVTPLDTDAMFPVYGTGGQQVPTDWTT